MSRKLFYVAEEKSTTESVGLYFGEKRDIKENRELPRAVCSDHWSIFSVLYTDQPHSSNRIIGLSSGWGAGC
jgi:hypothetical protein